MARKTYLGVPQCTDRPNVHWRVLYELLQFWEFGGVVIADELIKKVTVCKGEREVARRKSGVPCARP